MDFADEERVRFDAPKLEPVDEILWRRDHELMATKGVDNAYYSSNEDEEIEIVILEDDDQQGGEPGPKKFPAVTSSVREAAHFKRGTNVV